VKGAESRNGGAYAFARQAALALAEERFEEFLALFDDTRGATPQAVCLALQYLDARRPPVKIDPPIPSDDAMAALIPYRDGSGMRLDYPLKTGGRWNDLVLSISFEREAGRMRRVLVDLRAP